MPEALVGLGGNVGDVRATLGRAVAMLCSQGDIRLLARERGHEQRWGPRPIDIDLLAYDDLTLQTADLMLPHPRLLARAFVLVPLAEIAPERWICGVRVRDALARV